MTNNRDELSEQLTVGFACALGAAILAVPFYGFMPLLAMCAGLAVGAACFKAATKPKKQKRKACSR